MNLDIQEVGCDVHGLNCTVLAQDRNRWQAIVNAVLNIQFP